MKTFKAGACVIKVTIKNQRNLLAIADVTVPTDEFGPIKIKGYTIWQSPIRNQRLQEDINIKPPSSKVGANYFPHVFVEDKEKWPELERYIYSGYLDAMRQTENDVSENVNPDDIDL